jgi:hypothetical protein
MVDTTKGSFRRSVKKIVLPEEDILKQMKPAAKNLSSGGDCGV